MRVAVLKGLREIALEERPEPVPGPGEVVVEVALCGICGSDVHGYLNGIMVPVGTVMGHECVGTVHRVGAGVEDWAVGDRVAVKPLAECSQCHYCRRGQFSLCPAGFERAIGISPAVDGAFARYVRVAHPEPMLHRLPDEVSFEQGVLIEPLATSLHAVRMSRMRPGDTAVVIGAGTIGLGTVELLRLGGVGKLVVVEISEAKRRLALSLGADVVLDPVAEGEGLRDRVLSLTGGLGADLVYECAGVPDALRASYTLVKSGGQVLLVGINDREVSINPFFLSLWEVELKGILGYYDEFARVIDFMKAGRLAGDALLSATISLDEIGADGFEVLVANRDIVKVAVRP